MPTQLVQQHSEEGEPLLREEDEVYVPLTKQTQQTINMGRKLEKKLLFFGTSFFSYASLYHFYHMCCGQEYQDTNR
jgi:hypothetical protein